MVDLRTGWNRDRPSSSGPRQDNMKLRELLWLHHGHSAALYGDDGEMQCNHPDCVIDFKRDPVDVIVKRFDEARHRKMVELGWEKEEEVVKKAVEKTLDE